MLPLHLQVPLLLFLYKPFSSLSLTHSKINKFVFKTKNQKLELVSMDTPAPKILLLSLLMVCSTGVFMKHHRYTFPSSRRHLITVSPNPPLITVPSSTPVTVAPTATTPVPGQSWCVAKDGAAAASVQAALDYACGAGAECAPIQQGATCFSPDTLQNHASYAFSSFYQKRSGQATSCDFKGAAEITNVNPSSGSCIYPSLSSSTSPPTAPPTTPTPMTPATSTPFTPNPMTPSSSSSLAAPPTIFNGNSPTLGSGITGFGENPPTTSSTSSITMPASLQQSFISCIVLVASIIKVLDI